MRFLRGKKQDDQADQLRKLVSPERKPNTGDRSPTVVVLGAKGGVGVTTLTWRLGQSLADADISPLAVDAHLWQPDLARVAGVASDTSAGLPEVLAGKTAATDAVQISEGPAILPGDWTQPIAPAAEDLGEQISARLTARLTDRFNLFVIDGGPARTSWAESLCRNADLVLLVTTVEQVSLLAAYSFIKQCASGNWAPVRMVINCCRDERQGRSTHARLRDACREHLDHQVLLAGWLPIDSDIASRAAAPPPLMRPLARRVSEALVEPNALPQIVKAA